MSQKFCDKDFGGILSPPPSPPNVKSLFIFFDYFRFRFGCLLMLMSLAGPLFSLPASAADMPGKKGLIEEFQLEPCREAELKIEFLCNPAWEYHMSGEALLVVISKEPAVTVTFARMDARINYLYEINKATLAEKNLYRKGFKADLRKVNGQDVLVVRAFSRSEPQRRVLDFFYIHQGELFGALFAVNPIDEWDNYKFLIKTISESIKLFKDAKSDGVKA